MRCLNVVPNVNTMLVVNQIDGIELFVSSFTNPVVY